MHLYIHVPFCVRRCSYCDFAIAVRRTVPAERYVNAVCAEYAKRQREGWDGTAWRTVYLGGGTPSHLPPDALARLLAVFPHAADAEVTLEANPEDVSPETARAWSAAGVTRVSLGAQSFDDAVLAWMHRTHDAAAIGVAVARLREVGIREISLDLIFALPEELEHDLPRDLDAALALNPEHLSAYGLTREEGTPYARWTERGAATAASGDRYEAEFLLVHEALSGAGYEHYEISNYARPGHRARHNSAYWSGGDYLGLGPSAHSLRANERRWNLPHWAAYERTVASGADPVAGRERLSQSQQDLERVYLGLRTIDGLSPIDAAKLAPGPLAAAKRAGWLTVRQERLTPTPVGWLILDSLVTTLTA